MHANNVSIGASSVAGAHNIYTESAAKPFYKPVRHHFL